MKPGDLVITVLSKKEKYDPMRYDTAEYWNHLGLHGIIIRPVTREDGYPISSWCDWWVLIGGELQAWPKETLQVINETR